MDWTSEWDDQFIETCADWVVPYIGDLLSGRETYVSARTNPKCWRHFSAFRGPRFVLTHHPLRDTSVTFLSGEVSAAVATAARAAGDRYVIILGADVARQCIEAGLIDEVLIHVAPVLLGDGVRLLTRPGGVGVALELTDVSHAGQAISLRFSRRVKPAGTGHS
jgi:dihydrofolate reductase